jgi:hypothetical protein
VDGACAAAVFGVLGQVVSLPPHLSATGSPLVFVADASNNAVRVVDFGKSA